MHRTCAYAVTPDSLSAASTASHPPADGTEPSSSARPRRDHEAPDRRVSKSAFLGTVGDLEVWGTSVALDPVRLGGDLSTTRQGQ